MLDDFAGTSFAQNESIVVRECRDLAVERGYTFFGIKSRTVCVSGPLANQTFYVDRTVTGRRNMKLCSKFVGLVDSKVFVYTLGKIQRSYTMVFMFYGRIVYELHVYFSEPSRVGKNTSNE